MFVPVGMRLHTPFVRCPSSFANERCHITLVSSFWINFLYVMTSPVSGLKIALVRKGTDVFILCSYGLSLGDGVNVVLDAISAWLGFVKFSI